LRLWVCCLLSRRERRNWCVRILEVRGWLPSNLAPCPPEMRVEYNGQPVSSLIKMKFVFRNTGSSAIKGEDIREPVRLYFPKSVLLLNSSVDRTSPSQFSFESTVDSQNSAVNCSFSLLNSGDEAYLSVYAYNSEPAMPEVRGRSVDVRQIQSSDDSQKPQTNPFPFTSSLGVRRVLYWVLVLFNALQIILFTLVEGKLISEFVHYKIWSEKWGKAYSTAAAAVAAAPRAAGTTAGAALDAELIKKGIPNRPGVTFADWKTFLGGTLVFSVLVFLSVGTTLFILFSPRGF
jgi:hypothetical protein